MGWMGTIFMSKKIDQEKALLKTLKDPEEIKAQKEYIEMLEKQAAEKNEK